MKEKVISTFVKLGALGVALLLINKIVYPFQPVSKPTKALTINFNPERL